MEPPVDQGELRDKQRAEYAVELEAERRQLEAARPDLERRWAIASLARVAEMDEVPASEIQASVAQNGKSLDTEYVRTLSTADRQGKTNRDSKLRQALRKIDELTTELGTTDKGTTRERLARMFKSGQIRKQLGASRQQPILNLSGAQLDKALRRQEAGQSWSRVDEEVDGITKYAGSVNMGDLYDNYGQEIIKDNKNTAALLKEANSKRSGVVARLGAVSRQLAGKR